VVKSFKYRMYPTRRQLDALDRQLDEARRLYNAALQERRDAYRASGASVSYCDQSAQLKGVRAAGDCGLSNFSCCQNVLRRLDKAFKAFFRRVKSGEKAGYPRFKPRTRYNSITFPSYGDGCRLLDTGRLRIQGVGEVKVKLHRPIGGEIKTVCVKRSAGKWHAVFAVSCACSPMPHSDEATGIDVGLHSYATLSDGTEIENPRFLRKSEARLRRAARKVARRRRRSMRRSKAAALLHKVHERVRNQREDFAHKLSRTLVSHFGVIAVEDLNVKGLAAGMLAKSVNDAGWASFVAKLAYKAEEAGRVLLKVDPRGTSQRCVCGAPNPKELSQRWHHCRSCGLSVSRDHASALEILRLGRSLLGVTWPVAASVPREAVGF